MNTHEADAERDGRAEQRPPAHRTLRCRCGKNSSASANSVGHEDHQRHHRSGRFLGHGAVTRSAHPLQWMGSSVTAPSPGVTKYDSSHEQRHRRQHQEQDVAAQVARLHAAQPAADARRRRRPIRLTRPSTTPLSNRPLRLATPHRRPRPMPWTKPSMTLGVERRGTSRPTTSAGRTSTALYSSSKYHLCARKRCTPGNCSSASAGSSTRQ